MISHEVSVSELKDHLSECLRAARAGRVVTVMSHRQPVALLVPATSAPSGRIRKATRTWGSRPISYTGSGKTDSTALLVEERQRDRR